ncbi:expressed unknown protein [Seminavis robusta]|uniref:Uncharacterized protein n=1 Tax=Seminavis robusta TaxID=568900 RepID=A0A9N8F2H3_9STRA|nr:expressed unknown protein [Seminavis robusta]|eukprot:Sro2503_g329580.1 n/a (112) ;mRNA; f:4473-4887
MIDASIAKWTSHLHTIGNLSLSGVVAPCQVVVPCLESQGNRTMAFRREPSSCHVLVHFHGSLLHCGGRLDSYTLQGEDEQNVAVSQKSESKANYANASSGGRPYVSESSPS